MNSAQTRLQWNTQGCARRSQAQTAFKLKFLYVLSVCMAASSLLIPIPAAFSQTVAGESAQPTGQTDRQTDGHRGATHHTFLISPELDGKIASALLWTAYLGLPIGLTLAIWLHDKHTHKQAAELQQQIETLERIWQRNSQMR